MNAAFFRMMSALLTVALALAWLMQSSIGRYVQETYHRDLPGHALLDDTPWQEGVRWRERWERGQEAVSGAQGAFDRFLVSWVNDALTQRGERPDAGAGVEREGGAGAAGAGLPAAAMNAEEGAKRVSRPEPGPEPKTEPEPKPELDRKPEPGPKPKPKPKPEPKPVAPIKPKPEPGGAAKAPVAAAAPLQRPESPANAAARPPEPPANTVPPPDPSIGPKALANADLPLAPSTWPLPLSPGDKVFFVGDSLMQGVAPHVRRILSRDYGVDSIDLSRQSTGLAYTGFFNWPKTVAQTFEKHAGIKLMVVFLGPNDPWDIPVGKGKPYLRFKSPEWEAVYRERVRELLATAQAGRAQVMWVQAPAMRKAALNEGMAYLNGIYADEAVRAGQLFVSIDATLGNDAGAYSTHAQVDGKRVKVRIDDGVHFTPTGQRLIAGRILGLLGKSAAVAQNPEESKAQ